MTSARDVLGNENGLSALAQIEYFLLHVDYGVVHAVDTLDGEVNFSVHILEVRFNRSEMTGVIFLKLFDHFCHDVFVLNLFDSFLHCILVFTHLL